MNADLDDTANCPKAAACASCGATEDLEVATVGTPVGVLCATVCASCSDGGRAPRPAGWGAAIDAVFAHCIHLGIDADEMSALVADEERAAVIEGEVAE